MNKNETTTQEAPTNAELDDRLKSATRLIDDLLVEHHEDQTLDPSDLDERVERNEEALQIMHEMITKLTDIVQDDIESEKETLEERMAEDSAEVEQESNDEPRAFY